MKTFAVNPSGPVEIYVCAGTKIETISFRTRRQADKKIVQLVANGYTFDPPMAAMVAQIKREAV